jgi:hypothetical protein
MAPNGFEYDKQVEIDFIIHRRNVYHSCICIANKILIDSLVLIWTASKFSSDSVKPGRRFSHFPKPGNRVSKQNSSSNNKEDADEQDDNDKPG